VHVYRLCKEIYSTDVLEGQGGLIVAGRWHSQGRRIVYCASSEALAVLELRVHLGSYVGHDVAEVRDRAPDPGDRTVLSWGFVEEGRFWGMQKLCNAQYPEESEGQVAKSQNRLPPSPP
jgi:RES domain-containing protein